MIDSTPVTIRQALDRAAGQLARARNSSAVLDSELLLAHVLSCDREYFFREPERVLGADELERFQALVQRRTASEPLQHITGVQEFWSLDIRTDPGR